jgi:hypothetical protein
MVQIIDHIDKIARIKQRDVLMIGFETPGKGFKRVWSQPDHVRQKIIAWLDAHDIMWESCAWMAEENGWCSYQGQIYVDVPYDQNDAKCRMLCEYLEDDQGLIRPEHGDTRFYLCTLEQSMKNVHHDEPGFWDSLDYNP